MLGRYMTYLSELIETVRKAIRAGQSLEDAIATNPLGSNTRRTPWVPNRVDAQFVAFERASIAGTCGGPTKG